jgi:hypothetical protein
MCWTPLYVNKHKQRKQDRCLFFFSPWHYLSLFDLRLDAKLETYGKQAEEKNQQQHNMCWTPPQENKHK